MAHYISVDQLISNAQLTLGLQDDEMRIPLRQWAYDAQRSIGLSYLDKTDTKWKEIKDKAWNKPCGFVSPVLIQVKDGSGNCFHPRYKSNLDKCGCCENVYNYDCNTFVGENKTQFYLDSDATQYTHYRMVYYGLPVDDDGQPLIREENERAIVAYIEYMYTKRRRHQNRNEVPMNEVAFLQNEWRKLKGQAVGNQNMPHKLLYDEAMRQWDTIVPIKHLNRDK